MTPIFDVSRFEFPYNYKFPGQGTEEKILYVTRENPIMLAVRQGGVLLSALGVIVVASLAGAMISSLFSTVVGSVLVMFGWGVGAIFAFVGWWWVTTLWKKSIAVVTTKRLTKFIFTTPFNRHNLSLPLDMIVDTGSYSKGFLQALFKLETFTARSSAASSGVATEEEESGSGKRVNKKYFYIENIVAAEDLQHYIAKLLDARRHKLDKIDTFRPFVPHLKGEKRIEFMKNFPDLWS